MPEEDLEARFRTAIEQWRTKHKLAEDDAVLLLVELFKLHQDHWDELRRQRPPGCEDLTALADRLADASESIEAKLAGVIKTLTSLSQAKPVAGGLKPWVAVTALILAVAGAFICGRWTR